MADAAARLDLALIRDIAFRSLTIAPRTPCGRSCLPSTGAGQEDAMARPDNWVDVGAADELAGKPLRSLKAGNVELALSYRDKTWGAISNACNHVGGPPGDGRLDQDYIVCPWHGWKFHRCSGFGAPGFEADKVPAFPVRVEGGRVQVNIAAPTRREKSPHPPHPLEREIKREGGPLRVA